MEWETRRKTGPIAAGDAACLGPAPSDGRLSRAGTTTPEMRAEALLGRIFARIVPSGRTPGLVVASQWLDADRAAYCG